MYITTWCDTVVSPVSQPRASLPHDITSCQQQVQRADWVRTDANVLYGFAKKIPVQKILWYDGPENGRSGAPSHEQVSVQSDPESKQATYYAPGSRVRRLIWLTLSAVEQMITGLPAKGDNCYLSASLEPTGGDESSSSARYPLFRHQGCDKDSKLQSFFSDCTALIVSYLYSRTQAPLLGLVTASDWPRERIIRYQSRSQFITGRKFANRCARRSVISREYYPPRLKPTIIPRVDSPTAVT